MFDFFRMFWKIFSAIILGVRNFRVFEILEHLPYLRFSNLVLIALASSQGSDKPVHLGSLTRAFLEVSVLRLKFRLPVPLLSCSTPL